jgi:acyl-CoA dehydrogenase
MNAPTDPHEAAELLDGLEAFLRKEVTRRHEEHAALLDDHRQRYDESGLHSDDVVRLLQEIRVASAEAGYFTMFVPESLGGAGLGATMWFRCWERLFRTCSVIEWMGPQALAHWATGPSPVLEKCSAEMRERVLPGLMGGRESMCFGMSEPDAGTDVWQMKTNAERDGDGWRITGLKQWITNGPHADYILVFAVTDKDLVARRRGGISAFLVPTDSPGVEMAGSIKMFGNIGGDEGVFHFTDVLVDETNLVGELNNGFAVGKLGIGLGKLYNSAKAIGWGNWAMSLAQEHVSSGRTTFGRPLSDHQGIMFPLAESAAELRAGRLMALHCAQLMDEGRPYADEMAMAKFFAGEAGYRTLDRVIQTFGATGFTNEMHLTDAFIGLRRIRISDGSAEMMRRQVAGSIAKGRLIF